jgi:pseudo-response regulator 1
VTCAKSPRQVINLLNCEGAEMDIILAEVDLPVSKCFKMLKYIARNKELRHIPIISKLPSQFHASVQFLGHACTLW